MTNDSLKNSILAALHKFAAQRPGLEFGNYGDAAAYRSELRSITKDLTQARTLLRAVELSSITGEALQAAFKDAFSGRLSCSVSVNPIGDDTTGENWFAVELDYCTGQYWPTEYRRAVCAVAASALWNYYRDDYSKPSTQYANAGDRLRAHFRGQFGRAIANRWFN